MTALPPVCAVPDCGGPAAAVVTTATGRVTIRAIGLDPAGVTAWAEWLRCWPHTTAAVDQHIALVVIR
ncbi:hypothetical protein [Micromonospora carbonacea]|uniref:Uncharacterized protein n=1 Tax=Micromonospora carbonacea TaxID=47853 RepID=A0A1C4WXS0_9ACTN|nr:hypothetical protein [Micromonospora carbonacea]SCF01025.1 hypothetical protein GA0070563_104103 [Micromonospora carbonacea]